MQNTSFFKVQPSYYEGSNFYKLLLVQEGFLSVERNLENRVYFRDGKLKALLSKLLTEQVNRVMLTHGNLFKPDGIPETISRKLNEAATAAAAAYWQAVPFNERQARIEQLLSEISL